MKIITMRTTMKDFCELVDEKPANFIIFVLHYFIHLYQSVSLMNCEVVISI